MSILDHLLRIEDKLDKNTEATIRNAEHLDRNTLSLEQHMKRTENLEARVLPLERTAIGWAFIGKALTAALAAVAAATAILRFVIGV